MDAIQQELVDWIAPRRRERATTTTTMGIAMSQSSQGAVDVQFDASVLSDEEDNTQSGYSEKTTITTLPTTVYCEEGDHVIITLYGADGMLRPTVTGVSGGGDRMMEAIQQGGGIDSDYFFHDGTTNKTVMTHRPQLATNEALVIDDNGNLTYKNYSGNTALEVGVFGLHKSNSPTGTMHGLLPCWRELLWFPENYTSWDSGDGVGPITLWADADNYDYLEIYFRNNDPWFWEGTQISEFDGNANHNATVGCAIVWAAPWQYYAQTGVKTNTTLSLVVPNSQTLGDTTTQTLNAFIRVEDDTISFYANPGNLKIVFVYGVKMSG